METCNCWLAFRFRHWNSRQALMHVYYSRGFPPEALEWLISPFHTSPLGLVLKLNSDVFHMIQDMSFPCSHGSVHSVNQGISPDDFPTTWRSFKATSTLILSLPPGCTAATFNISEAYCLTPICPDHQQHLCIMWQARSTSTKQ